MSKDFYSDDHTVQAGAPGSSSGNLKLEGEVSVSILGARSDNYKGSIEVTDNILLKARTVTTGESYGEIAIQGSDLIIGEGSFAIPINIEDECDTTIYGKLAAYTDSSNHLLYTASGNINLTATAGVVNLDSPTVNITGDLEIDGDLIVNGSMDNISGISNNGDVNISATNGGDINLTATGFNMISGHANINLSGYDINLSAGDDINISSEDEITITAGTVNNGVIRLEAGGDAGDPYLSIAEATGIITMVGEDLQVNLNDDMVVTCAGDLRGEANGIVYFKHSSNDAQFIINDNFINVICNNDGSGGGSLDESAMTIINAWDDSNADVLYLKNFYSGVSGGGNNFIVFFDGVAGSNDIGAIEGDGSGGITLTSGSADYGEWLAIGDLSEWPEYSSNTNILGMPEGTLVWVKDSKIWRQTGSTPMIVTHRAIVCGNKPKNSFQKSSGIPGEILSFIGQVPVLVEGEVEDGDLIIPVQGSNHCRAVNPEQISFSDYRKAIGTAWGKKLTTSLGTVNCAIRIK
jgi:hypothetical protein